MNEEIEPKIKYKDALQIQAIGTVLSVDEAGYIKSESAVEKIPSAWRLIVDDIIEAYTKNIPDQVHSIYVKGSVSRGTPIENVSDIDCVTLVTGSADELDLSWLSDLQKTLKEKYPFCTDFDLSHKNVEDIISGRNKIAPVLLKTMATCVYGDDIIPDLPKVKPGKGSLIVSRNYGSFLDKKLQLFASGEIEDIKMQCKVIMKRILRAGFELVMERDQTFTRDLYPCYKIFSKYYPEKEEEMREALELAINTTGDKEKISNILNNIGQWIVDELESVYSIKQ